LVSRGVRERIVRLLDLHPQDRWLEIGAGRGEVTAVVAAGAGRVWAVETDARLVEQLRTALGSTDRVEILHADILTVRLEELAERAGGRLRVYGNLPYAITSPILAHLFASPDVIADIFVVVQREVAERLVARAGTRDFGYLSALAQFHTEPRLLLSIPPGAFRPPPRVHSALVHLAPRAANRTLPAAEADGFLRFLRACFRQKRKTLVNNLRDWCPPAAVEAALAAAGHTAKTRAEQLGVDELLELCRRLGAPQG
jgi:16S rRNA (adenine1518-N6/adenine1519-N6)-dimethyltransferase